MTLNHCGILTLSTNSRVPVDARLRDIYELGAELDNKRHFEEQDDLGRVEKKLEDQKTEHDIGIAEKIESSS